MGGTLNAEDTPGGGLTMVLTLRAAGPRPEELFRPVRPERQVT
jgi:two-component system, OmpR family, sensor histidine kinase KdpD